MNTERRIAIGVSEEGKVWTEHFGIAPYFQIYDTGGRLLKTRPNPASMAENQEQDHSNPLHVEDLLNDCQVYIAGLTGHYLAFQERRGIEVMTTAETDPLAALQAYLASLR